MMDLSMEKAFRSLKMEIRIKGPIWKTSLKGKDSINGKIPLFIKEPLFKDPSMDQDYSFSPTVKPLKNTMITIRKST